MKHLTASTSPSPFSGENWFDPLEDAIRFRVRALIEAVVRRKRKRRWAAYAPLSTAARPRDRNGQDRQHSSRTFGALTVSLPRVRRSMGMAW